MAVAVAMPASRQPPPTERLSAPRLWALTSASLAYGFMLADQGLLLAPLESEHLFPQQASLGLAAMAVCCGLAQVCGPAAGRWSDQHHSSFGRRRPCLLMAAAAVAFLSCCLTVCSELRLGRLFMFIFLLQQLAWNVVQTVQAGLVPDLVATEQRGAAGGATAANTLAGALGALLVVRLSGGLGLRTHYATTVGLLMACLGMVCLAAKERPSNLQAADQEKLPEAEKWGLLRRVRGCYEFDVRRHPQFAKLLLSKTLYCASVMVKGFLLFFVQDTFKLGDAERNQAIVGDTAVAAEATAALTAIAAIMLLDAAVAELRAGGAPKKCEEDAGPGPALEAAGTEEAAFGLSPSGVGAARARRAAIVGTCWMGLLWLGPLLVGLGVLRDGEAAAAAGMPKSRTALADAWAPYMVAGTAVWGLGQGLYLAGDQALSYALLPDPEEASRLLGLTSLCASAGAVFGGSATGGLLYAFGSVGEERLDAGAARGAAAGPGYGFPGYAAMFLLAGALSWAGCGVLASVRMDATTV